MHVEAEEEVVPTAMAAKMLPTSRATANAWTRYRATPMVAARGALL